jgi:hypothetical protein
MFKSENVCISSANAFVKASYKSKVLIAFEFVNRSRTIASKAYTSVLRQRCIKLFIEIVYVVVATLN